jgi:ankyrin repeat protein
VANAKPSPVEGTKEIFKFVKRGDVERVRELLAQEPALVHARDVDESTPLHHAAWKGHAEVAALLLEAGADVNAQNRNDHWGGTPLHAAAHGNQKAVAEILLARGADLHATSCNGRTPIQETTFHKATSVANLLKRNGAVMPE